MRIWWGSVVVGLALTFALTAVSEAASVAYTQGGNLWLSSLNGKQKRRVAAKPKGKVKWIETAQSDSGRLIAIKRDPAKIANLNSYVVWGPTGRRIIQGSLTADSGWLSYVMPLSLDLSSDGKTLVYGYQYYTYNYPVSNLEEGTSVKSVSAAYLEPVNIVGELWPTTVGNRIVAQQQNVFAGVQKANKAPYGNDFTGWFSTESLGLDLQRTDVSANKRVAAAELVSPSGDDRNLSVILVAKISGLGGTIGSGACLLPAKGQAENVSISQDGRSIAWEDDRGVVAAGIPTFGGSDTCKLTRGAVVISRTGTFPSIGPARVSIRRRR